MADRRHRGALRQQILDAADRLLFELGDAHDVSIEAVVAAVGCTPPALYYYFPSKERLIAEVCRRQYERFAEALEARIETGASAVDQLRGRGHAYLDWAMTHPEHYRILFMTQAASPSDADGADPSRSAGLAELVASLERGITEGSIQPGDPLLMALMLWSTVHGIASLAVANPALPADLAHAVLQRTSQSVIGDLAAEGPPRTGGAK